MSSPITLSGFNNIDFNLIVDAILQQERAPIQTLESSRDSQQAKRTAYGTVESRLASIESASNALSSVGAFEAFTATPSNDTVLSASAGTGSSAGSHTIDVIALARAQVLASTSSEAATDTTVADGGTLTVGTSTFNLTGATTLEELRDLINADDTSPAQASLIDTGSGFKLVLSAKDTGTAGAFTVQNNLTLAAGASLVAFGDTDGDGESGDSAADNSVVASDASLTIDGIAVTRSTNTVEGALAGVDLTLESVGTTNLDIQADVSSIKGKLQAFVTAYNDLAGYLQGQIAGAGGAAGPLAGDFLTRSVSSEIRSVLRTSVANGGTFANLAEVGIVFDRTGRLSIDDQELDEALAEQPDAIQSLFQSGPGGDGLLPKLEATLERYLGSNGLLATVDDRIDDAIGSLNLRIANMEDRLLLREQELRQQFTFADQAISSLNNQGSSITTLGQLF